METWLAALQGMNALFHISTFVLATHTTDIIENTKNLIFTTKKLMNTESIVPS